MCINKEWLHMFSLHVRNQVQFLLYQDCTSARGSVMPKEVKQLAKILGEWLKDGITSRVHAEMLRIAKVTLIPLTSIMH